MTLDPRWFAEDGLMRLDPDDDREPFPGQTLRTVKNENGIYFRGHEILLNDALDGWRAEDGNPYDNGWSWYQTVLRLQSQTHLGIFYRHPGNLERDEAHDNYVAIAGISAIMAITPESPMRRFPKDIMVHGRSHLWSYNSKNPKMFSFRHLRQPGEIGYYYACDRKPMHWLCWAWFQGGIRVNMAQSRKSKHNNPSTSLLAFMRLQILSELRASQPYKIQGELLDLKAEWHDGIKRKYGSIAQVYEDYFTHPEHPLRKLSYDFATRYRL